MYCLSSDGLRAVNAHSFYIKTFDTENEAGERFGVLTGSNFVMETFKTKEEAADKLQEVVEAACSGISLYRF